MPFLIILMCIMDGTTYLFTKTLHDLSFFPDYAAYFLQIDKKKKKASLLQIPSRSHAQMIRNCIWHNQDWSLLEQTESEKPPRINSHHRVSSISLFCLCFQLFFRFEFAQIQTQHTHIRSEEKCRKNEHERERKLMSKKWRRIISHFRSFSSRFYSKLTFLSVPFSPLGAFFWERERKIHDKIQF